MRCSLDKLFVGENVSYNFYPQNDNGLEREGEGKTLTNLPQPVRPAKRLQGLQPMPRIQPQVVLPESLPRRQEAFLLRDDDPGHRLPRVLLWVPNHSDVLDGLLGNVLQELELQLVFGVVVPVEFLQPVAQNVVRVRIGLDRLFIQLPLRVGRRDEAELGYVVAEAVRGLGILPGGL